MDWEVPYCILHHYEFKCYGHPVKGKQDWVEVKLKTGFCKFNVSFSVISQRNQQNKLKQCYTIKMNLAYMKNWNTIFLDNLTSVGHYMVIAKNYQDEDHFLIRGWSRHTARIKEFISEGECPPPTLAMVSVQCIMKTLIAIEDTANEYPHSLLLVKSRETWAGAFVATLMQERACRAVLNK